MRNPERRFTNFHPAAQGISCTATAFPANEIDDVYVNGGGVGYVDLEPGNLTGQRPRGTNKFNPVRFPGPHIYESGAAATKLLYGEIDHSCEDFQTASLLNLPPECGLCSRV